VATLKLGHQLSFSALYKIDQKILQRQKSPTEKRRLSKINVYDVGFVKDIP